MRQYMPPNPFEIAASRYVSRDEYHKQQYA